MWHSYDNYLHCEKQCNGLESPTWFLTQNERGEVIPAPKPFLDKYSLRDTPDPQILNYASDILYRGCDRYRCKGPIDKILKGLKKNIFMLAKRFRENSRSFRCGFKVKGHGHGEENGWNPMAKLYFGEENIRTVFKLYSLYNIGNGTFFKILTQSIKMSEVFEFPKIFWPLSCELALKRSGPDHLDIKKVLTV